MELHSKSQLNFALPLLAEARKQRKKAETKKAPKMSKEYRAHLNRIPDEHTIATIKDLRSKDWDVSAIACGLDLTVERVSEYL